ncbi:MAG: 1-acyl-sn-glycerol-3-phosphate acyltransferase [Candidatus Omnitrophica bacterium]|nr:1-acyl-sn-glycerol-3-phosphate acyltransferase [Candidatus Omnitrophota bacterium]
MVPLAYSLSKCVCWLVFRLGFGLEVRGQHHVPRRGSACPRRVRFMARATLFRHPVAGTFFRSIGTIPIRRGEGDVMAIRAAVDYLRKGEAIALFAEGTRQVSGRLGSAKRGVGLLAIAASVPIVPVVVNGTFDALPPHAARLSRSKIRVAFGPPVAYTDTPIVEPVNPTESQRVASRTRQEQLARAVTRQWRCLAEEMEGPLRPSPENSDDHVRQHHNI